MNIYSWITAGFLLLAMPAHSMPPLVTLPELVQKSNVIAYGRIDAAEPTSARPAHWLQLQIIEVIKGLDAAQKSSVFLCNERPAMRDWPKLHEVMGTNVFFLVQKDGCYEFSHSDRAIVHVRDDVASTVAIKDQPANQPLAVFLEKIRTLVAREAKSKR